MFEENGPFKTQNGASSQLWICCKDCVTMLHSERGKERYGNHINGFSEKTFWGNLVILAQKWCVLITLDLLEGFFKILDSERGKEVSENFISCFSRKNLIWGNLIFLGHFLLFVWAWSKLIQATVTIGSLNSQGIYSFLNYLQGLIFCVCT